jgi:hypothetical protein
MQHFWPESGFTELERNDHGWLRVTPGFFRAILMQPQLAPIAESGGHERRLHARLLDAPSSPVTAEELGAIEDADTRENYVHFLRVRKLLADAVTLERFYLRAVASGNVDFPPLFLDLAVQNIVRGLLDGSEDVYAIRAGECFFRRQRLSTESNRVLSADAETIQSFADSGGFGSIGRLIAQQGTPLRSASLDVLSHESAQLYWLSSDRFRYVLDLTHGGAGLDALAFLLGRWVRHFLGVEVSVRAMPAIEDASWLWHVGLDVESTAILNALYAGETVDDTRLQRLVGLFRLDFADASDMRADVAGKPVYLGLAMNGEHLLKLKPQNLLLNLPIATKS